MAWIDYNDLWTNGDDIDYSYDDLGYDEDFIIDDDGNWIIPNDEGWKTPEECIEHYMKKQPMKMVCPKCFGKNSFIYDHVSNCYICKKCDEVGHKYAAIMWYGGYDYERAKYVVEDESLDSKLDY